MAMTKHNMHMLVPLLLTAVLLLSAGEAGAALWLSDTVVISENFDGMGTGSSTPTDWRIDSDPVNFRTVGTWVAAQTTLLQIPPDPTGGSGGNIYNWWCGANNATAVSRSPGWLSSAGTCRSGNLYAQLVNCASDTLSGVTLSYDVLKFRNGDQVGGWTVQLYYSKNGTAWTSAGSDFATLYPNDGNTTGYGDCPAETQSVTGKSLYVELSKGDTLYLCWNYSVTSASSSSNGMGLGIDNVSLSGIAQGAAQLQFNEFNKLANYGTDTPWIEFKVLASGVLYDTFVWSRSTSVDTYYAFGSGQNVSVGEYVVLWFENGADDANKASGESANAWDLHLNYAAPQNGDNCYAVYASGSTVMTDFFAWASLSTAIKSSCSEAIQRAYQAGQWDTFGATPDCFDAAVSLNANGAWGIQRDPSGSDTNSKYGWSYYMGAGTPGSANPAFHSYAGEGAWAVSPVTVSPSATETINVSYVVTKHDFGNADHPGGYITMTVPAGWTAPQNTDAAAAGYVTLYDPNGMAFDLNPSLSSKVIVQNRTVIVALGTDSTFGQDSLTVIYGAGVAPAAAGSYAFTLASDPWGSNVRDLDSSPSVTVGTPPQVILRNVPDATLLADTRNATLLAGRIVGEATGDTLLGITVTNLGTATSSDTADSGNQGGLSLWLDADGDSYWDTGDSWVATLNYRGAGLWGISSSTVLMPGGVFNFVVTTNIGSAPTNGHTFNLRVAGGHVTTSQLGVGPTGDTANTGVQTISYNAAYAPFIWSLMLDSHSVSKLLAEQTYSCTVTYGDTNGYAEIDSCAVLINSAASFAAGDSCAYFKFVDTSSHFYLWNDTTQAWIDCGDTSSFTAAGNNYVTLAGGTVSRNGTTLTVGWVFRPKFGWEDEACNVYANATDSVPSSPGWQNRGSVTTENDLTFTGQAAVTSGYHGPLTSYGAVWVRTGETLTWSGLTVVYQGTAVSPDNAYFDIRITDTDALTDTIDVTGVLDTLTVAGHDAGVDTYRFTISNRPGGTDVSDTWFTLRIDPVPPNTTAFTGSSASTGSCTLTWTACADDGLSPWSTYEIFYNTTGGPTAADTKWSGSNDAALGTRTTATTTVTGLNSSTTYYFVIRGVDTSGNYGVLSAPRSQTTAGVLTSFSVTAPASATVSTNFNITITALDALGGTLSTFADTVTLWVDSGAISPLTATGFVGGVLADFPVQLDTTGLRTITVRYGGVASDLFFSEYIESVVGNDKALEIFNGTGAPVSLTNYTIRMYTNGSPTVSSTYYPTGTIANNDVFVIANTACVEATIVAAKDTQVSFTYNGNDVMALAKSGVNIDIIGMIGDTPATEWGSGDTSTADATLVRKSTVTAGDAVGTDSFYPDVQWWGYSNGTYGDLGSHTFVSSVSGTAAITITAGNAVPAADTVVLDSHSAKLLAEQTYSCTAVFTDVNGCTDIDTCVAVINGTMTAAAGDSGAKFMFNENTSHFYLWNDTTQAWTDCGDTGLFTVTGNNYVTLTGGTVARSGSNLTVGWVFRPKFGWDDEACTVYVGVTDSAPADSSWQSRTTATTENDLTFTGQAAVASGYHGALTSYGVQWVKTGETLTWSGLTVVYQGTSVSPDNAYFDIRIGDTDGNTDTYDYTGVLDTVTVAGGDAGPDTYRFTIVNRAGGSDVSDTWFTLKIDPIVPVTTAFTGASATAGSVTLNWTACADDGLSPWGTYEIYYNTAGSPTTADSKWSSAHDAALGIRTTATTTVTGLNAGTAYHFVLRGVDTACNYGGFAAETDAVTSSTGGPGMVLITEVSWGGVGGGAGTEWFELYNNTGAAISLNGWTISDNDGGGCTHTFGAVTIPARGYFLVEAAEAATSVAAGDIYGDDAANLNLAAGGDNLILRNAVGVTIDLIDFSASWPAGAAAGGIGNGFISMERRNLDTAWTSDQASNWLDGPYTVACGATGGVSGTPGTANSMAAWSNLKINEVHYNQLGTDDDEFVELYNAGDTPINIHDWVLTNHSNDKVLPCLAIPGRAFIVLHYSSGTDQTVFSGTNSVLHLYAGVSDVLINSTRDAVGLYTAATPDAYNVIDFMAYAVTPGTAMAEAQAAVDAGLWPANDTQIDIVDAEGRSIYRIIDGGDSNVTGDWTQLSNTMVNFYSEGGTNKSNLAATLTAITGCTVLWTTSDATGYRGGVGDSALIRLTGTDGNATGTDVTNCTVSSSVTDGSGHVVLKLTETGLNTGIYEGWLNLRSSSSDGQWWIGCASGEVVTIRSVDSPVWYDTIVIGASTNPGVTALLINEFLANDNSIGEDTEFIEVYNPTDTPIYIAGCYLDDIGGGGSSPYLIPVTGTATDTIPAYGFRVYYGSTTLINLNTSSNDAARLLANDSSVISNLTYATMPDGTASQGRCHDGSGILTLFDGVNDPGPTPGATNNPVPVITQVSFSSSQPSRFYWNTVQDTSVPGGAVAATCTFSSSGIAQNITCTVYARYAYNDATCTGSDAFGDGVQTAAQSSMPYTVTYSIEAGAATQNLTLTATDTCGQGDSLTIRFAQDNTAPSAPASLTASADTAVPDTGVRLAWSSVSGETVGYYVYVDTDGNGQAQRLSGLLTDTTGFLADSRYVTVGDTYVFFVVCVDSVGNESLHSDTAQAPVLIPYKLRDTVSLGGAPVPARPGATVAWRIGAHNAGFGPAPGVVITDAIIADMEYKTNSADTVAARGYQAVIEYSHDSGATWDASQAAPVTNIRWTITGYQYTDSIIEVKFETFIR